VNRWDSRVLWRYIVLGKNAGSCNASLVAAAEVLVPDVIKSIREGVCPFCGMHMTRRTSHLTARTGCGRQLYSLLEWVSEVVRAARAVAGVNRKKRAKYWACAVCGRKFRYAAEAVRHVLEAHRDAVEGYLQLISGPAVSPGSESRLTAEDASIL